MEAGKARAVRGLVGDLCAETRDFGPDLVDSFGIPEALLPDLVRRSLARP
jgi:hypothetical protein